MKSHVVPGERVDIVVRGPPSRTPFAKEGGRKVDLSRAHGDNGEHLGEAHPRL